jgi:cell division septation protein DedD
MQEEAEQIELELPEGEVDIHEADVDDSIKTVPEKEPEAVEATPVEEDELDKVSDSVQKRIDKLTYKMREAERQRDEAVNYAQSIHTDNSQLKEKLKNSDSSLFKEYDNRIQSDLERAKINLKDAQELGDGDAIATATENLSRSAAESENLKRLSAQQQLRQQRAEQQPAQVPSQSQAPAAPDPKAEEWASKNKWFGDDQAMTFAAFGVHKELVEQGVDPTSDDYYAQVDSRMQEYFPQKFSNEQSKPVQQVAASSRGATGKKNARKVKLTPSQVAIAKRLNVPLEEYAKHIEAGV